MSLMRRACEEKEDEFPSFTCAYLCLPPHGRHQPADASILRSQCGKCQRQCKLRKAEEAVTAQAVLPTSSWTASIPGTIADPPSSRPTPYDREEAMTGKKRKSIEAADPPEPSPVLKKKAGKLRSLAPDVSKAAAPKRRARSEPADGDASQGTSTAAAPSTEGQASGRVRKKKRAAVTEKEPTAAGFTGKKRRKSEAAPAGGEAGGEPAGTDEGPQPKKRRRRSRQQPPAGDVPEEERQRRERQRQLRELALKMRAEGKKYRQPRKRAPAAKEKAAQPAGAKEKGKEKGKGPREEAGRPAKKRREETGTKPEGKVEVLVVPIFWNRKPQEKERVVEAAVAVERLLAGAGVAAGTDTTNALSPGQKFAYWEHRGVLVRVECGPKEADCGQCVLALTATAGSVARRQTYQVGPDLLQAVGAALGRQLAAGKSGGGGAARAAAPAPAHVGPARAAAVSGDDVGGDFAGLEPAAEEAKGGKKKKKQKRM